MDLNEQMAGEIARQLGLSGSTVSLIGINSYNWVLGHLATVCGIGTIVPLDKGLPYVELRNSIEKSRSSVLIFDKEHAELAERIAEDGGCIRTFICMDDIPGYICFTFANASLTAVWPTIRRPSALAAMCMPCASKPICTAHPGASHSGT